MDYDEKVFVLLSLTTPILTLMAGYLRCLYLSPSWLLKDNGLGRDHNDSARVDVMLVGS